MMMSSNAFNRTTYFQFEMYEICTWCKEFFTIIFAYIVKIWKKKLNLEIEIEIPLVILLTFALFLGRTCHYRKSRLIISHISPFEKEREREYLYPSL